MQVYLEDRKALAYYGSSASAEFWDEQWATGNLEKIIRGCLSDNVFIPAVKKYLPKDSMVLEGGCGMGHLVHALKHQGYRAIGIDFASKTVESIHKAVPELDVRVGDVRSLSIADGSLDGYISVGVIEHFWEGYDPILDEMARTIRTGGYLFISFPYMSLLRRWKAHRNKYTVSDTTRQASKSANFYQFALEKEIVIRDILARGFLLSEMKPFDGVKGMKDEVSILKRPLSAIYSGQKWRLARAVCNRLFSPFAGHCILLVFKKA